MEMAEEIKRQLEQLAEPEFRIFTSRLMPNVEFDRIMGVRLPYLRKLAKQILKEDYKKYLEYARDDSYEEIMLQGMVIGGIQGEFEEAKDYISQFVPKIDNWSVCDSFCAGLKLTREYPDKMWIFLDGYLRDTREYFVRFGIVMLLMYYIEASYLESIFHYMDSLKCDQYYVKMAAAWAVSMCFVKFPEKSWDYLKDNRLDDWTYHKALQKIRESQCIDKETKERIKQLAEMRKK